jgi:hypothetical protein
VDGDDESSLDLLFFILNSVFFFGDDRFFLAKTVVRVGEVGELGLDLEFLECLDVFFPCRSGVSLVGF